MDANNNQGFTVASGLHRGQEKISLVRFRGREREEDRESYFPARAWAELQITERDGLQISPDVRRKNRISSGQPRDALESHIIT